AAPADRLDRAQGRGRAPARGRGAGAARGARVDLMARRRVARPLAPLRALALAGAALAGLGCATPPPAGPPSEEELLARAAPDSRDRWPHLGLARLYARRGDATLAIEEYGEAISRLPPRTVTTPVLELGVLHDLLGNPDAALR